MSVVRIKKEHFILAAVLLVLSILSVAIPTTGKWLLVFSLEMCFYFMRCHRYNQPLLIVLIFVATYFAYMLFYYFGGIKYSTYQNLQTLENTNGTLRIVSLFVMLLFCGIKQKEKGAPPLKEGLKRSDNQFIYFLCLSSMALILTYAFRGHNILNYQYGESTTNSSLFEYYFIFAIIAQCNAGKKYQEWVLIFINFVYAIAMMLLGLRLVTLMVIMLVFVFYFDDVLRTIWVVLGAAVGFLAMSALSVIRSGSFNINWLSLLGIRNGFMVNNQGDVFLTSSVHFGMVHNGFMGIGERLESLAAFIINFFLPSSKQLSIGILNKYIQGTYYVGGGGFGAVYAYVWLGYLGVVLLGLFLAHFINSAYLKKESSYYGLFLIITSFRWFAYSLPIVFKMGIYLAIVYFAARSVSPRMVKQ